LEAYACSYSEEQFAKSIYLDFSTSEALTSSAQVLQLRDRATALSGAVHCKQTPRQV